VLLSYKDRAEIAGSEFVPASALSVMEGIVIVTKKVDEQAMQLVEGSTGP